MSGTPARPGRPARTREAIAGAGRRLFAAQPVDAVAIDDIVREAAVSKGSFYNHFEDKEALVRDIVTEIRVRIERAVETANAGIGDAARRTARGVCVYFRYALDEPQRAAVLLRIHEGPMALASPLNRGLAHDIVAGLAQGRFDIATTESGVLFVMGVAQVGLGHLAREPAGAPAVAQQLCALLLRGLGVPPGEASAIAAQSADEIVRGRLPL